MGTQVPRWLCGLLLVCCACATPYDETPPEPPEIEGAGILVFTKIAGFRHPSIEPGAEALASLAESQDWTVVVTDNGAVVSPAARAVP